MNADDKNLLGDIGDLGVAVVDCGVARMSVGAFRDDAQRTLLTTLLAQWRPAEVLVEKGALSAVTLAAVKRHRSGAR